MLSIANDMVMCSSSLKISLCGHGSPWDEYLHYLKAFILLALQGSR